MSDDKDIFKASLTVSINVTGTPVVLLTEEEKVALLLKKRGITKLPKSLSANIKSVTPYGEVRVEFN